MLQGDGLRLHPAEYSESGAAWFVAKQQVEDGFSMSFDMRITQVTPSRGGDGLAFVFQNANDIALGVNASGMGYEGIANSLAVEFDTYQNSAAEFEGTVADPNANHVSVQSRGGWWHNNADPVYSLGAATDIPYLADGAWHRVQIDYTPGTLTVWLDGAEALTVAVDLADYVILDTDGSAYVGFTAATGDWPQIPDVRNIEFTPAP
jgi:hypothetical protein